MLRKKGWTITFGPDGKMTRGEKKDLRLKQSGKELARKKKKVLEEKKRAKKKKIFRMCH